MIHLPTLEGFGGVEVVRKCQTMRVFSKCVLRASDFCLSYFSDYIKEGFPTAHLYMPLLACQKRESQSSVQVKILDSP